MATSFEEAFGVVLEHETLPGSTDGSYTNTKRDKGGPTKWGITQRTLSAWRGKPASAADVAALEKDEAQAIYKAWYWMVCRCGELADQVVATKVFDVAVNCGPGFAVRMLQRACNVVRESVAAPRLAEDGKAGPATIALANRADAVKLVKACCAVQKQHYLEIITDDPTQAKFKAGWLARAAWPFKEA